MKDKHTPLPAKNRFNFFRKLGSKQRAAVVIVVFAIVGVAGTLITNAAQIVDEETVRLFNGQEIRLGQSIESVSERLNGDLEKINDEQYVHPKDGRQPIEVVLEVDKRGRVVIIHLKNSPDNVIPETDARIGQALDKVRAGNRRARDLRGTVAQLSERGVQIEQKRSTQYLLGDNCSPDQEQVDLVSLVKRGHESRFTNFLVGPECHD